MPALVDTGCATECLREGMEVTVDAEERVIYEGIVKELLQFQTLMEQPFADAREFRMLRRMLKKVSPLSLTDPESKDFVPEKCRTYHDITRFCHETVVREFINLHLGPPCVEAHPGPAALPSGAPGAGGHRYRPRGPAGSRARSCSNPLRSCLCRCRRSWPDSVRRGCGGPALLISIFRVS